MHFDVRRMLLLYLLVLVITLMFATIGIADSVVIRPTGNYNVDLDIYGAASNYQCVDDEISDGDSTYVYNNGVGTIVEDLYYIDTFSNGINGIIDNVTVYQVGRKDGSETVEVHGSVRANGTTSSMNGNFYTTSYETFTTVFATNPGTGQPWEWCDFTHDNFQFGIELYNYDTSKGRCTQCWVEINYHEASADVTWHSESFGGKLTVHTGGSSSGFTEDDTWTKLIIPVIIGAAIILTSIFLRKRRLSK